MALYESDVTRFIKQLKADRPTLEVERRLVPPDRPALALLGLERRREELESRVPQQPYPYQSRG